MGQLRTHAPQQNVGRGLFHLLERRESSFDPRRVLTNRATFIHEQLYSARRRPFFQSNACIRSGSVAEIDGKRPEPCSVRGMPKHGEWKYSQKSSGREQI